MTLCPRHTTPAVRALRAGAAAIALIASLGPGPAAAADPMAQAQEVANRFQSELRERLMAAMTAGGPPSAVQVCREEAPAIAARLSADSGWTVKRVGTRARNPSTGTPDAWESAQLDVFAAALARGEPASTLRRLEEVRTPAGRTRRYAQAIIAAGPCLVCHGDPTMQSAELKAALRLHYPLDQATGYREGELRGAFSLQQPVP